MIKDDIFWEFLEEKLFLENEAFQQLKKFPWLHVLTPAKPDFNSIFRLNEPMYYTLKWNDSFNILLLKLKMNAFIKVNHLTALFYLDNPEPFLEVLYCYAFYFFACDWVIFISNSYRSFLITKEQELEKLKKPIKKTPPKLKVFKSYIKVIIVDKHKKNKPFFMRYSQYIKYKIRYLQFKHFYINLINVIRPYLLNLYKNIILFIYICLINYTIYVINTFYTLYNNIYKAYIEYKKNKNDSISFNFFLILLCIITILNKINYIKYKVRYYFYTLYNNIYKAYIEYKKNKNDSISFNFFLILLCIITILNKINYIKYKVRYYFYTLYNIFIKIGKKVLNNLYLFILYIIKNIKLILHYSSIISGIYTGYRFTYFMGDAY